MLCLFSYGQDTKKDKESRGVDFENTPTSNQKITNEDYHAVLIAVNDYKDSAISDLQFPIRDAGLLKKVLVEKYAFNSNKITFLENPTESEITKCLMETGENLTKNVEI